MPEGDHTPRPPIHCVLWHAPDAPPAFELTALLVQRGLTLETCDDPFAAAARVCRHERAQRARRRAQDQGRPDPEPCGVPGALSPSASGLGSLGESDGPTLVLLLAEPSRLAMRDAVSRVLELHAPRTVCWVYERGRGSGLRTIPLAALGQEGVPPASRPPETPGRTAPSDQAPAAIPAGSSASRQAGAEPAPRPAAAEAPAPRLPRPGASRPSSEPVRTPEPRQVPINSAGVLTDEELAMLLSDDDPPPRRGRTSA